MKPNTPINEINIRALPQDLQGLVGKFDFDHDGRFTPSDLEGHWAAVEKKSSKPSSSGALSAETRTRAGERAINLELIGLLNRSSRLGFNPQNASELCARYNELRAKLDLKPQNACLRFGKAEDVFSALSARLKPHRTAAARLQALTYAEREFLSYLIPSNPYNPLAYRISSEARGPNLTRYSLESAAVSIHDPITGVQSFQRARISFDARPVDSEQRVLQNLQVTLGNRALSAREIPLFLPDLVDHLGSSKLCKGTLGDESLISFEHGRSALNDAAKVYLDTVAEALRDYPRLELVITGAADTTGDSAANQELAFKRARAVERYLTQKIGLAVLSQLHVRSVGETSPVTETGDGVANVYNRNVQIAAFSQSELTPPDTAKIARIPRSYREFKTMPQKVSVTGLGDVYPVYFDGPNLSITTCEGSFTIQRALKSAN